VFPRLSNEEMRLVEAAARLAELTPAGYTAKAAVAAARADAGPVGTTAGDLRDLQRELFAARRAVTMLASTVNQAAAMSTSTGPVPGWVAEVVRRCVAAVARLDAVTARIHRRLR
jgi:hypothetical protein